MRTILVLTLLLFLASCQEGELSTGEGVAPQCRITGPTQGLHPKLMKRLCRMGRHFGKTVMITPNGGCRGHGSRRAPDSLHKRSNGCRAADVVMTGVSKRAILDYWETHGGGGVGYYCSSGNKHRPFVHVDIGSTRGWTWYCGRGRR